MHKDARKMIQEGRINDVLRGVDVKAVHVMNMNTKRAMVTDAVIVITFLPCINSIKIQQ